MDAQTCLQKLKSAGTLAYATADADGNPQIRSISAIHYELESLYFFTARGKAFCRELLADGRSQLLANTELQEMIRLSGKAVPVPEEEQDKWMDVIFEEQPYLANIYPGETRKIGIIFKMEDLLIEYFNLGVHPVFRETYAVGAGKVHRREYEITDRCTGCGTCRDVCPQKCILPGNPCVIMQEHCLHCGACFEICPEKAVKQPED